MPQFGLGVFQTPPETTARVVKMAVEEGYRAVDTASMYRNEEGVGMALDGRTDVFITTKLGNSDHGFDEALRAFEDSARRLRRHTLDLYLIHWPRPRLTAMSKLESARPSPAGRPGPLDRRLEFQSKSSRANHRRDGRHASSQPDRASSSLSAKDPARVSRRARDQTESGSPRTGRFSQRGLCSSSIAAKHRKTPAQVVLRWHLDSGLIVIPKTVRLERLRENIGALAFRLDDDDMRRIEALDLPAGRIGPDPATAAF